MIIVDTGFWVALLNDKDRYHQSAQETNHQSVNIVHNNEQYQNDGSIGGHCSQSESG